VRCARAVAASIMMAWFAGGCGGHGATTPTPVLTPVPTPTPPINSIAVVSSVPAAGNVVHTGLPNPARSLNAGVTTGLTMTFMVASAVDRAAKLQVMLMTAGNSVCLTNAAPVDLPPAPLVHLAAGMPQTVSIRQLLLTSECWYPGVVIKGTARLVPPSAVGVGQTPFYETQFAIQYTIVQ